MISLIPFSANLVASVTICSIGVDLCLPRIKGMAQKEQGLSQPSAIFKYA